MTQSASRSDSSHDLELNGARYHVVDRGAGSRTVLLLHGMPDTSSVWRHQVEALVGAGFRAVVPDMLGYGGSDKPPAAERYRGGRILADLFALLDALELERVDVVGHDWGAFASWEMVLACPERFRRHVAVSVGHPDTMTAMQSPAEVKESWFQYLNAQDDAPELYAANDGAFFKRFIIPSHPEVDEVWTRMKDPLAMIALLNWDKGNPMASAYLATARRTEPPRRCLVPTLGIWSDGDRYLWEEQMRRSEASMSAAWRYQRIDGASHWVMLDRPGAFNELLLDWLRDDCTEERESDRGVRT